ncbi:MAG: hypothetical protein J6D52_08375, partial [Clostridia bacterium]|nr:hypothetical protein [Clostridia bacterium]
MGGYGYYSIKNYVFQVSKTHFTNAIHKKFRRFFVRLTKKETKRRLELAFTDYNPACHKKYNTNFSDCQAFFE